ncbi:hypothetical protein [Streptomyces sp. R35]|uniref:Lipoprotein n=1 Tax=Streptomyces sp. R35 TaxID=3238630 RepID=A0AB39SCC9_9ACTN
MSRTARCAHGRGRPLLALLAIIILPAMSGCSSPGDAPEAPRGATSVRPAAVSYAVPADVTSMVLPVTGEESRGTQGLDALGRLAAAWAINGCARKHGETVPDAPPPLFIRSSDLPDLAFLRVHGFDDGHLVPGAPPTAHPGDAPATPSPVLQGCLTEGRAVARDFQGVYAPLQSEWMRQVSSLGHETEVRRAYRGFADCVAEHDLDAKDENAFFALVDKRQQVGDSAGSRKLAGVYATCMKPVEAVREPLRKQLSREFRAAHAAEIAKVRSELPKKIHELEKRYRIRISFPKL